MNKKLQLSCRLFSIVFLILALPIVSVFAQTKRVTGRVTFAEDGSSGSFVGVIVKGTPIGTTTSETGAFVLNVPEKSTTLIFTLVGYERKEIVLSPNQTVVNVTLAAEAKQVDEVIVIGYGQQKKPTVTGAVSTIGNKDLAVSPVANITNALAGRLPGLITQQRSGLPGNDAALMYIRGLGTFNASNQSPLVMVDGVERPFSELDYNEVETISMLKDASSTAVFGVRGANGAIIVTTKRGQIGAPKVSMSLNYAMQTPTKLPNYLGSYDYATLYNEAFVNDGGDPNNLPYSASDLQKYKDGSSPYTHPDVNWYTELMKKYAPQATANLNIRGGTRIAKYYISGTYLAQEGLFKYANFNDYNTNAKYDRVNFRSNIDFQLTKDLVASVTMGGRRSSQVVPGGGRLGAFYTNTEGIFLTMGRWAPNMAPIFNPNGTLGAFENDINIIGELSRTGFYTTNRTDIDLSVRLTHKLDFIFKGLSARTQLSYDGYFTGGQIRNKGYSTFKYFKDPITGKDSYIATRMVESPLSFGELSFVNNRNMYAEAALEWAGTANGTHNFTSLLLLNAQRNYVHASYPFSRVGLVGRVTYNHKDRYFAEVNMGYNGTENFAKGNRMGFFPSLSAGWALSNEQWFKNSIRFINYLKIRGSYGKVGSSEGIGRFAFMPTVWGSSGFYRFGSPSGVTAATSYETAVGNPNITWETAWKRNFGVELNTLQNSLAITFDIFDENRENILLIRQDIPGFLGYNVTPGGNWGAMYNKGYELELKYNNNIGGKFRYNIGGNIAFAKNKIIENSEPTPQYEWMKREGRMFGQSFGLTSLGFFNSFDEIKNSPDQSFYGQIQPGDIKYKDLNGDNKINHLDVGPIGNTTLPLYTFGISGGFSYKDFDMSFLFQGVQKTSVFVSNSGAWDFNSNAKVMEHHLGRWTEQTKETATYPRLTVSSVSDKNNYQFSDFWLKDANYVRLKNLEFGYKLPDALLKKIRMQAVRVFTNGQNLFTWSDLKLFDPEIRNATGSVYPQQVVFNMGLNVTF